MTALRLAGLRARASVHVRAPGKVNLALHVSPLREDGYHGVVSVFQAVSLYEDVTATDADDLSITVSGPQSEFVPLDDRNIAWTAATLLAEAAGVEPQVQLHLAKGVPVAGGMAGGSADGAATLLACDALWQTGMSREQLMEIAGEVGSDVPFALAGHTAVGTGRGHVITPAMTRGEFYWVFGLRHDGQSTAAVYGAFDQMLDDASVQGLAVPTHDTWDHEPSIELMHALRSGDPYALGAHLRNDLENAAVQMSPELVAAMDVARGAGALGALVSGSGPTIAALASSRRQALSIAAALTAAGVVDDAVTATGNVPGARIVAITPAN